MPASIGVNLRVTGHCRQGGRKYMEDFFSVAYQQTEDERDLEYAFFGIYDGHGGAEAAEFAKERLMETIVRHRNFWSDNDEDVLRAIKMGYLATHYAMWKEQENWPRTASGLPSTAGTTASVAFIRRGKIFVGHVGDSAIVLGYQEPGCSEWKAKPLTRDHKPECANEMSRIQSCGGKVVAKSGVARVVWNRPRIGHKGPVRRSTPIDEIPFLAVARSLGDLWSYNSELDAFVVSPDPDCSVVPIDTSRFRCLIFGTDGLFNMLSPQRAVAIVQQAERHNEESALSGNSKVSWVNPSKCLVEKALEMWSNTKIRADNTSVVTLMLDPPGPPRAEVLKNRRKAVPDNGLRIMTRYPNRGGGLEGDNLPDKQDENRSAGINSVNTKINTSINTSISSSENLTSNSEEIRSLCDEVKVDKEVPNRDPLRESLPFHPNDGERVQGRIQHKIRSVEKQPENQNEKTEFFVSQMERRRRLETLVPYGFFLRTVPDLIPSSSPEVTSESTNGPPKSPTTENIQINEVSSSSSSNEISDSEDLSCVSSSNPGSHNQNPRPKIRLRSQPFRRNRLRKRRHDDGEDKTASEESPPAKRPHEEILPQEPSPKWNLRARKMTVLESVHRRSEEMVNKWGNGVSKKTNESVLVDVNVDVKRGRKSTGKKVKKNPVVIKERITIRKVGNNSGSNNNNNKGGKVKKGLVEKGKKMNKENQRRNVLRKTSLGSKESKSKVVKKVGVKGGRTLKVDQLRKLRNHVLSRTQRKS